MRGVGESVQSGATSNINWMYVKVNSLVHTCHKWAQNQVAPNILQIKPAGQRKFTDDYRNYYIYKVVIILEISNTGSKELTINVFPTSTNPLTGTAATWLFGKNTGENDTRAQPKSRTYFVPPQSSGKNSITITQSYNVKDIFADKYVYDSNWWGPCANSVIGSPNNVAYVVFTMNNTGTYDSVMSGSTFTTNYRITTLQYIKFFNRSARTVT